MWRISWKRAALAATRWRATARSPSSNACAAHAASDSAHPSAAARCTRARRLHIGSRPEIIEIEPVIGCGAARAFEPARIRDNGGVDVDAPVLAVDRHRREV